ncbi:hypothetical protein IQ243_11130 [Nostocales cyanobacterium LEGE 11386]|nr:hypothetical protein [Nostocales cyanobacterium LEGE 11386]
MKANLKRSAVSETYDKGKTQFTINRREISLAQRQSSPYNPCGSSGQNYRDRFERLLQSLNKILCGISLELQIERLQSKRTN